MNSIARALLVLVLFSVATSAVAGTPENRSANRLDAAETGDLEGVVFFMQADTFNPTPTTAQQAVVDRIAERTSTFGGKVVLVQGDTHEFVLDDPRALDNFTRIVVHGETLPFEYLRLTIDPRDPALFSFARRSVTQP